jgi:hypothetical protein
MESKAYPTVGDSHMLAEPSPGHQPNGSRTHSSHSFDHPVALTPPHRSSDDAELEAQQGMADTHQATTGQTMTFPSDTEHEGTSSGTVVVPGGENTSERHEGRNMSRSENNNKHRYPCKFIVPLCMGYH